MLKQASRQFHHWCLSVIWLSCFGSAQELIRQQPQCYLPWEPAKWHTHSGQGHSEIKPNINRKVDFLVSSRRCWKVFGQIYFPKSDQTNCFWFPSWSDQELFCIPLYFCPKMIVTFSISNVHATVTIIMRQVVIFISPMSFFFF